MVVTVECIGLALGLAGDLRRLDREADFQFLSYARCQDHQLTARGRLGPVFVLASAERADSNELEALLQLARGQWRAGRLAPVILLGSQPVADVAWRSGVIDFVTLPATADEILARLLVTRRRLAALHPLWKNFQLAGGRLDRLTDRERYILERLTDGWWIKRIAAQLGTSPNTVRNQRATILQKLQAESEAEMFGLIHAARWFQAVQDYFAGD